MSLSALAAIQTNPQAAGYLRRFRAELGQSRTGSGTYQLLDHWRGVVRGLHMAQAISTETRDNLENAMQQFAGDHAADMIERMRACNQEKARA